MSDTVLAIGILAVTFVAVVIGIELSILARRAWFFRRTRRFMDQQEREYHQRRR